MLCCNVWCAALRCHQSGDGALLAHHGWALLTPCCSSDLSKSRLAKLSFFQTVRRFRVREIRRKTARMLLRCNCSTSAKSSAHPTESRAASSRRKRIKLRSTAHTSTPHTNVPGLFCWTLGLPGKYTFQACLSPVQRLWVTCTKHKNSVASVRCCARSDSLPRPPHSLPRPSNSHNKSPRCSASVSGLSCSMQGFLGSHSDLAAFVFCCASYYFPA